MEGTNETLTVTYTDNSTQTFTQTFGDWVSGSSGISGQYLAATMSYRDYSNGSTNGQTTYVYGYKFALNAGKTVKSLTLPSDSNLEVLAIDLRRPYQRREWRLRRPRRRIPRRPTPAPRSR